MNFLKKIQSASKLKKQKNASTSGSFTLNGIISDTSSNHEMSDADILSRKAEFLELLAKEERAHRVKLAELRNEPIKDRRAKVTDNAPEAMMLETAAEKTSSEIQPKARIPLAPVSPNFESPSNKVKQSLPLENDPSFTTKAVKKTTVARPSEAQTRADIGRQIGGTDFLVGGSSKFKAPDFSAEITDKTPQTDVTPQGKQPVTRASEASKITQKADTKKTSAASNADASGDKDPYADMDFTRPIKGGRANVSELRLDVSRITSDIENGDALYRRAQQRVSGLMQFVERAEVDFSLLERIEPENRRLKARNAVVTKELEENLRQTALLESDLDEHRRRLAEINVQYDTVNGNLAKAMKALSERDHEIRQLTNDLSSSTLKLDREKTTTEVEIRENNVLRERVINLTNDLEDTKTSRAEAVKIIESLKIDLEDHRNARERVSDEAYDLRHALDEAQKQNNQMKGEMVALHQDISTFKTQYEFNLISRDDRIILLEAQIEDLARQVLIKEDIVSSAARDVTELRKSRTGGELERERLEKIIDSQTMQLDIAQKQILEHEAKMEEMEVRYRDVAAALSITQNRREQTTRDDSTVHEKDLIEDQITDYKLGLRSSMIPQELHEKLEELSLQRQDNAATHDNAATTGPMPSEVHPADDFDTLDQETIEDRIMDYKLGLRKNIF